MNTETGNFRKVTLPQYLGVPQNLNTLDVELDYEKGLIKFEGLGLILDFELSIYALLLALRYAPTLKFKGLLKSAMTDFVNGW
jgi:hypothetical protein